MARRTQAQLQQTYREQALKLFPWICAHCGREFDGKKLSQLTVHHKDNVNLTGTFAPGLSPTILRNQRDEREGRDKEVLRFSIRS